MKPLVATKVKRGAVLREWIDASTQATDAGRADFWARQLDRMKRAQADSVEQENKVRDLRKVK